MAGKIITVSDLDVFEEDLSLSELTYVNDDNFPFKYTINRKYSNSNKNVYICSDKKLDFALDTYNSTYEQIYANADNARAKILNSNVDANNNVVISITSKKTLIALIAKDTDAKIRNSLTGVNLQISKSNNWLGQSSIPISFDYSISTDLDINYKIVENIDDISKEFECVGPNNYSIDLVNIWDTLKFGRHSISIDVYIQETLKCNITHIFEKMKEPITTLPTTASLKQAIVYNKEIEKEIEYQSFKLKNNLIEKGVECSDTDKMSSLVDSISKLEVFGPPILGDIYILYSVDERLSVRGPSDFVEVANYTHSIRGGTVKVSFDLSASSGTTTAYSEVYKHTESGIELLGEFSKKGSSNLLCVIEVDLKVGDSISFMLKCTNSNYLGYIENLKVSCDRQIL